MSCSDPYPRNSVPDVRPLSRYMSTAQVARERVFRPLLSFLGFLSDQLLSLTLGKQGGGCWRQFDARSEDAIRSKQGRRIERQTEKVGSEGSKKEGDKTDQFPGLQPPRNLPPHNLPSTSYINSPPSSLPPFGLVSVTTARLLHIQSSRMLLPRTTLGCHLGHLRLGCIGRRMSMLMILVQRGVGFGIRRIVRSTERERRMTAFKLERTLE
jgi:hypothetical protein